MNISWNKTGIYNIHNYKFGKNLLLNETGNIIGISPTIGAGFIFGRIKLCLQGISKESLLCLYF